MNQETPTTKGEISRRELLKMAVPLGTVRLGGGQCTGCGLCAAVCPTHALTASAVGADGTYRLSFRHGTCVACNECVAICPEHCLVLERGASLEERPPEVLCENEMVGCPECGKPVGSRAMINKVRALVPAKQADAGFELCPECKARAQFRLAGR
ncbi:MAG: 4Fe-4S dicluster domain-containing protein [Chloroflexota bacterium]